MVNAAAIADQLACIDGVAVQRNVLLSEHTRFGLGGPAAILADAVIQDAFVRAWRCLKQSRVPLVVIGGGSNLVVCDEGFDGVVLRYTAGRILVNHCRIIADAGAQLQHLVDSTIEHGLAGIHTMTGIPGWVGGAIYGNAGAYGRSINQSVVRVRFFDGVAVRDYSNQQCSFRYRESTFKDNKGWVIFSAELQLENGEGAQLRGQADQILAIRNAKYPPSMKCAGSIFKNLLFDELPGRVQSRVDPKVIREGKVPSAWFLEQVGAKGLRNGGICVADYHANLIYNEGNGTAREVREIVNDLKNRIRSEFEFEIEEEVQYVGLDDSVVGRR
jgi:UDP-N-acetylmuramate dehydrogenase